MLTRLLFRGWPTMLLVNSVCWGLSPHCGQVKLGWAFAKTWAVRLLGTKRTTAASRIRQPTCLLLHQCEFIRLLPLFGSFWSQVRVSGKAIVNRKFRVAFNKVGRLTLK